MRSALLVVTMLMLLVVGVASPAAAAAVAGEVPSLSLSAALDAVRSQNGAAQESAAAALAYYAEAGDPAAISALIALLDAAPSKLRYHADWGLARAGEAAVPPLRAAFEREHEDAARARIAQTLGRIGPLARAAAPEMIAALDDPQSATASHAAYALGAMRMRDALPALVRAYAATRKLSSQSQMAAAIDRIGSDQAAREARETLVRSVVEELASPRAELRERALVYTVELLRVVRQDSPSNLPSRAELAALVPPLERALDDPSADHLAVVRGLGYAGADAASAVPALQALLDDPATAQEAARALAAIATPAAKRILEQLELLASLEKRVRQEYSVNDHQGRLRLLPFDVFGHGANSVRMETRFLFDGDELARPTHIVVSFESYSPEARFAELAVVEWRADGERLVMGDLDRRQSSSQLGVIESVSGTMPIAAFQRLVAAERVEASLASLRIEVAPADRTALRHFASKIPTQQAAAPRP